MANELDTTAFPDDVDSFQNLNPDDGYGASKHQNLHDKMASAMVAVQTLVQMFDSGDGSIELVEEGYAGEGSHQVVAADLDISADAGSEDGSDPSFIAAIMGHLFDANVAHTDKDANYMAGVIGSYNVQGANPSTYPKAAVLGLVGSNGALSDDDVAIVMAVIDGDSGAVHVGAFFGVGAHQTTPGWGVNFGLDLQRAAHDDYDDLTYDVAPLRLGNDICIGTSDGALVDYTDGDPPATGEGTHGKGSLVVRLDTGDWYKNTGTKAEPTWELIDA